MYSIRPNLVIGFHGCDETLRDAVILGKTELKPSTNKYDWLGNGIYFWENNSARAFEFIHELYKNPRRGKPKIKKPSVLGAVFSLGNCFDLLDNKYLDVLKDSYSILETAAKTQNIKLPENKSISTSKDLLLRYLDCSVIEKLHEKIGKKTFDSVRGVFFEGDPLYPNAGFTEKNHIQIAIRNPNCIKGYFIPRTLNDKYRRV